MAGLDPMEAWSRTPAELAEYLECYGERMERTAFLLYRHAYTTASMVLSGGIKPWEAFPGWIKPSMEVMDDDTLEANVMAWCG